MLRPFIVCRKRVSFVFERVYLLRNSWRRDYCSLATDPIGDAASGCMDALLRNSSNRTACDHTLNCGCWRI